MRRFLPLGFFAAIALGGGLARAEDARVRLLEARAYAGVHVSDYSTLNGATQGFTALRASAGADVVGPLQLRLDGLFGRLTEGALTGAGALRLYGQSDRFLVGASYARTTLEGDLTSDVFAAHGEVYEGAAMTATSSFGYERKSFGDSLFFAEVFLRIYAGDRLVFAPGASYAVSALKQTRADIILRGEWTLAAGRGVSLALYAQYGGNVFTRASAGLIVTFDGGSARSRDLRAPLGMARFD